MKTQTYALPTREAYRHTPEFPDRTACCITPFSIWYKVLPTEVALKFFMRRTRGWFVWKTCFIAKEVEAYNAKLQKDPAA